MVTGAQEVGPCEEVVLRAGDSYGGLGRPLSFQWSSLGVVVQPGSSGTVSQADQDALQLAVAGSLGRQPELRLPLGVPPAGAQATLQLTVANFLAPTAASSTIVVSRSAAAVPAVQVIGGTTRRAVAAAPLKVQVRVGAAPCTLSVSRVTSNRIVWVAESAAPTTGVSLGTLPAPLPSSATVSTWALDDGFSLLVPGGALRAGVTYVFAAQVQQTTALGASLSGGRARLQVEVVPQGMQASLGASVRLQAANQPLEFSAVARSGDLDGTARPLKFAWACMEVGALDIVQPLAGGDTLPGLLASQAQAPRSLFTSVAASPCMDTTTSMALNLTDPALVPLVQDLPLRLRGGGLPSARGPLLRIPSGRLAPGRSYVFELAIDRNAGASPATLFPETPASAVAYAAVGVSSDGLPLQLDAFLDTQSLPPGAEQGGDSGLSVPVVNAGRRVVARVVVIDPATGLDVTSRSRLQWEFLDDKGTAGQLAQAVSGASTRSLVVVRGGALPAGQLFELGVRATDPLTGRTVEGAVVFRTSAGPRSGVVQAADRVVSALSQNGTVLETFGWTDDTAALPLRYRFGYYRISADVLLPLFSTGQEQGATARLL